MNKKRLKSIIAPMALLLLSLFSCSSEKGHPYSMVEGAARPTRLYKLASGIKIYITPEQEQPRTTAALCLPGTPVKELTALCTAAPLATDYALCFAHIGAEPGIATRINGSTVIHNNIPSNETENWAIIMRGTLASLPDSAIFILTGGADCDAAVTHIDRHFSQAPRTPSAATIDDKEACDIAATLGTATTTPTIADILTSNADTTITTCGIELLPSPPYTLSFPDESEIHTIVDKNGRRIVTHSNGTQLTLSLHCPIKDTPATILSMVAEYINCNVGGTVSATATADGIELLTINPTNNPEQTMARLTTMLDTITDSNKFHRYLAERKAAIDADKQKHENIAAQTPLYLAHSTAVHRGLQQIATHCMNSLRFTATATPTTATFDDTPATWQLLPQDSDTTVTIFVTKPHSGIDEQAAAMLFNKAATLAAATPRHGNGTYIYHGSDSLFPFSHKEYEAAKNYLLYAVSTLKPTGSSLVTGHTAALQRGYTASQLYDALSTLSFNDIKDFHETKCESPLTTFIVGRQSSIDQRELSRQGTVVHITYDELFGY